MALIRLDLLFSSLIPQKRQYDSAIGDCEPDRTRTEPTLIPADLTTTNLLRLIKSYDPSAEIKMPSAASEASSKRAKTVASADSSKRAKTAADSAQALCEFGVDVDTQQPFPKALQAHINSVVRAPRPGTSPTPAKISGLSHSIGKGKSEATIIAKLVPILLWRDTTEDPPGEDLIYRAHESQLIRGLVQNKGKELTKSMPDVSVGYGSAQDIPRPAFSKNEERVLSGSPLSNTSELCTFITLQVKNENGSMTVAAQQGARDGVAINNYLSGLFNRAKLRATVVQSQHWSMTANHMYAQLWVHWMEEGPSGGKRYYMREVQKAFLGSADDDGAGLGMPELRGCLQNILDFAKGTRLDQIKQVLARIMELESSTNTFRDEGFGGSINSSGNGAGGGGGGGFVEDDDLEDELAR